MAEVGGMIASALLKVVGQQIGSVIEGKIKLQQNFDNDLNQMKVTLESVEALLKDAEKQSITNESVHLWLERLKDAMYEISDMIDDFEEGTEAIQKFSIKKHLALLMPCLTIGPRFTMANKMEKMRDELKEITDQHRAFKFVPGGDSCEVKVTKDERETSSTINAPIVGRAEEEGKIWASLSKSKTEELTVLAIHGIGGLGKSTLAQMVYNNKSQFEDYTRVWIYVSPKFDLDKIGNSIITQLSENENEIHYTDKQMIHKTLAKRFDGKKILIVLDDLWEENISNLDSLISMLKVGNGSKVVVMATTRNEDIARKISTIPAHKLAPLTDEMCWTIIKQKCDFGSRGDKEQLKHIGEAIAAKCRGVALAAQSLGHILHAMTYDQWKKVRDSDIWNVSASASDPKDSAATKVIACLRLSYTFMPTYLKLCFAYCATFPKGRVIFKDDLIYQWISLGFIAATTTSSIWELSEIYISQLLKLSFLEHSKASSTEVHSEDITSFTMHDLVHDLARSVMKDEILVSTKDANTKPRRWHYALLDDGSKPLESPRIRALRFLDSAEIRLHDAVFSSAESLRVLDLSKCSIHKLPDSIGRLKRLRYLNSPRVQDTVIPDSITMLSTLIYLSLRGSATILALPESIGEMKGLMYLDLSGCSGIQNMPKSLGKLRKLVHLNLSGCWYVHNVSEFLGSLTELQYLNLSGCKCIGKVPASLGDLSELQYLNLSFSSYLKDCTEPEVLGALTKLEYLNLSGVYCHLEQLPEGLGSFAKLKYLNLSGSTSMIKLPKSLGNLKSLVHLDLKNCQSVNYVPEAFNGLTSLRYLNLSKCLPKYTQSSNNQIDSLMDHICTLVSLEHLDLSGNTGIRSIPESIGNLQKLHTLDLSGCYLIREIPESIGTIDSLKFLDLRECKISYVPPLSASSLSLPLFVVHASDGDSSSNLHLLKDTNPVNLEITRLENVKSVEEARSIKLMENEELEKLTLEWTSGAERSVDDKVLLENLVPRSTLRYLHIRGYNGVSFPDWVSQVPSLGILDLSDMEHLEEWSTSDSGCADNFLSPVITVLNINDCPKLRMKSFLPRVNYLRIRNSDNVLSSWGEINASSSSCPIITTLEVRGSELPLHQWGLLCHLHGLTKLDIQYCGDLTGSPDIIQHMSFIETLRLKSEALEDLPKWLGELASLKELVIYGYIGQKELDENIRKLTKLQKLQLDSNGLSSLPHWLIELTCLKKLDIRWNEGITSLPEGIQQLTSLQELSISYCPELIKWCVSEENKMKLAHIKNKILEGSVFIF